MDKKKYIKCHNEKDITEVFRIVDSEDKKYKYSVEKYDKKTSMWIVADIYANTLKECREITKFIFDAKDDDEDNGLHITIDYGDNWGSSESDYE